MGSDDLHKKRKEERGRPKTARHSSGKREKRARYLIVCEDTKSAVFYFNEIAKSDTPARQKYTLEVQGSQSGSSPDQVLAFAKKLFNAEKESDPYTEVFCVFDRDRHETFDETLAKIKSLPNFTAITSNPSFEFWLLLHFQYTRSPFKAVGKKSSGDKCLSALNAAIKHKNSEKELDLPPYQKNDKCWFSKLLPLLPNAIRNAQNVLKAAERDMAPNPSTNVHFLMEKLGFKPEIS